MSRTRRWFKPRWAHRNPEIRARAVTESDDPELLQSIDRILLDDDDATVRLAALHRVTGLATVLLALDRERAREEREALEARAAQLARRADMPLTDRVAAMERLNQRELTEALARHAPEPELRAAAVQRVDRQGLLGDLAVSDPDAEVRRAAATRITQPSTLQRAIDGTRKTDKALHQALLQRQREERLAAGDPTAVREEALSILAALEVIPVPGPNAQASLEERWSSIATWVEPGLDARFKADLERVRNPVPTKPATPPVSPVEPTKEEPVAKDLERPASDDTTPPPPDSPPPGRSKRDKATSDPDAVAAANDQVERLAGLLESGELHAALALRGKIQSTVSRLGRTPDARELAARVGRLQGRLRELRDWEHWANNRAREQLIQEAQALTVADLHPDALLARLKELQQAWKQLEKNEQIPGDRHFPAPAALWRPFQEAGNQAFERVKPYLDKRTEVQQQVVDSIEVSLSELQAANQAESPDLARLRRLRQDVAGHLRQMDQLPVSKRRKMANRLRAALDKAGAHLDRHHETVETAKRGLIRKASQLSHVADPADALTQAKRLQSDWQAAGSLWRKKEQALWEEFRAHIDPLFEAQKSEKDAERAEQRAMNAAQQALLDRLRDLGKLPGDELLEAAGPLAGLRQEWSDIERPARSHQQAWEQALRHVQERMRAARRAQAEAGRQRLRRKAECLTQCETAVLNGQDPATALASCRSDWPDEAGSESPETELDAAWHRWQDPEPPAMPGAEEQADALENARALCIQLEFLAGLSSPKADQERRMRYQVERLSETMGGSVERQSAQDEALAIENQWLLLRWLPEQDRAPLASRIQQAMDELNKQK